MVKDVVFNRIVSLGVSSYLSLVFNQKLKVSQKKVSLLYWWIY